MEFLQLKIVTKQLIQFGKFSIENVERNHLGVGLSTSVETRFLNGETQILSGNPPETGFLIAT